MSDQRPYVLGSLMSMAIGIQSYIFALAAMSDKNTRMLLANIGVGAVACATDAVIRRLARREYERSMEENIDELYK